MIASILNTSVLVFSVLVCLGCSDGHQVASQLKRKVSTMAVHHCLFPLVTVQTTANMVSQSTMQGGWYIVIQNQTMVQMNF